MKAIRKLCCVSCIVILFMSGCSTKNTKQGTSAQNASAAQSTSSSTSAVSNSVSSSIVTTNSVSFTAQINKSKLGKPIKASHICADSANIYYISPIDNMIYSVNKSMAVQYPNGNVMQAGSNTGGLQFINETASELLVSNNIIYYTDRADENKIYTIGTNGQNKKKLVDESVHNMILMGNYIYYIDDNNNLKVFDTSKGETYFLQANTRCFDSDGTSIYYGVTNSDGSDTLSSMNVDGTGNRVLSNDSPTSIIVNGGKVFYTNGGDSQILYYITTDGKARARYSDIQAENIQYSGGYIYYANAGDFENLYKILINGSQNTKVVEVPFESSFVVNNGAIYFVPNYLRLQI